MIQLNAIYVLWLREMKRFWRARSRLISMLAMPVLVIVALGMGFRTMVIPGAPSGMSFTDFLVPGMIGMNLLFSSLFAGISVIWDREHGFLKEIMVAPVSRVSIAAGRVAGGSTTAIIQGIVLLALSPLFGFKLPSVPLVLASLAVMALTSFIFISVGLIFASFMKDDQGFNLIMNFIMMPILFLSGAFFPLSNLPGWLQAAAYASPLALGIDGLRAALMNFSRFPLAVDLTALGAIAFVFLILAAFFFDRSEAI